MEKPALSRFLDPLWNAAETAPLSKNDFANAVADDPTQSGLTLAELSGLDVNVAAFEPHYDADRNLWFCDIVLKAPVQYFPFVRLALARYQPISVSGAHLSPVVPSDFIQVLPHRTVTYDTAQANVTHEVEVRVNGPAYLRHGREPLASPLVIARVERRRFDTGDELGWEVMTTRAIPVVNPNVADTVWKGKVQLPDPSPGPLRILILEAEIYATDPQARLAAESGLLRGFFPQGADPAAGVAGGPELGYRIAFADAIELP